MEEEIIYYLYKDNQISIFRHIYNSLNLRSLQDEIYIEGDNYWCKIVTIEDFIKAYKKGNYAFVEYAVEDDKDLKMVIFSYTIEGYLLVGLVFKELNKTIVDQKEKLFDVNPFIKKKCTIEQVPFRSIDNFFK